MREHRGRRPANPQRAKLSNEVIAGLLEQTARHLRDPEYQRRQREYLLRMYEEDVAAERRGDYRESYDLRETEKQTIAAALAAARSISEAARLLGIDRSTLHRSMKRHGIAAPSARAGAK